MGFQWVLRERVSGGVDVPEILKRFQGSGNTMGFAGVSSRSQMA